MSIPKKIDGHGTHKNASTGTPDANFERQKKFVMYYASEALTRGDAVALNFAATEPANGYGNHVLLADTDDALNQHAMGVVVQDASSGALVEVQVEGYCDFAKINASAYDGSNGNDGLMLAASATGGQLGLKDVDEAQGDGSGIATGVAILVKEGTAAAAADSKVWLINPLNQ